MAANPNVASCRRTTGANNSAAATSRPAAHQARRTFDANVAIPNTPSAINASAVPGQSKAISRLEPTSATAPMVTTELRSCVQTSVCHSQSTASAASIQNAMNTLPPR
jgi:hypothetical protein